MKRIVLFLTLVVAPLAHGTQLSLFGGASLSGCSAIPRSSVTSMNGNFTFGFGGAVRAVANPIVNLEIGVDYMPRNYSTPPGGDITFNMLEFPVTLRFNLWPFFNLGLGGYYAIRLGDVTNGNGPLASSFSKSDLGLVGAAAFEFPVGLFAFLIEARYLFGFSDLDPDPIATLYTRNWQFWSGIKIGL